MTSKMSANTLNKKPFLVIDEQPGASYFRNESEIVNEKHGCVKGVSNNKTYPTVRVINGKGNMKLVVTPLNEENGNPHFCRLASQNRNMLSTQYVDPCKFDLTKKNNYTEKLKIAVFIPGKNSSFLRPETEKNLGKIVLNLELFDENGNKVHEIKSDPFSNKRNKLEIKKMSAEEGSVAGGSEIWIVCSRLQLKNNNIEVRFSKDNWETYVKLNEAHNQDVLIINSPSYNNQSITEPVVVDVQLKNQIDGTLSEKFHFTYQPSRQAIKRCASPIDPYNKENNNMCAISSNNILSEFLLPKRKRIEDSNTREQKLYLNEPAQLECNDNNIHNSNTNFSDSNIKNNINNNINSNTNANTNYNNNYNNNGQCESQDIVNSMVKDCLNISFGDTFFDIPSNNSSFGIHSNDSSIFNDFNGQYDFSDNILEVLENSLPKSILISDNNFPCGITEEYLLSEKCVLDGFPYTQTVPIENY